MQGDVIEYILYDSRKTGHAIPNELRAARIAIHRSIRRFGELMHSLLCRCCGRQPRYVLVRERPDPRLFTTFMLQAHQHHVELGSGNTRAASHFSQTFRSIQRTHWPASPERPDAHTELPDDLDHIPERPRRECPQ